MKNVKPYWGDAEDLALVLTVTVNPIGYKPFIRLIDGGRKQDAPAGAPVQVRFTILSKQQPVPVMVNRSSSSAGCYARARQWHIDGKVSPQASEPNYCFRTAALNHQIPGSVPAYKRSEHHMTTQE